MREIKFRGKRIKTGDWAYGFYYTVKNHEGETLHKILTVGGVEYPVDPKTVGLFTGLPDKNGKEIYEGDIFEYKMYDNHKKSPYIVEFVGSSFVLSNQDGCTIPLDIIKSSKRKVIGNIYENPELLKSSD